MVKSAHRGRGALLSLVLALVGLAAFSRADAGTQAYYYDAAGRLTGVVDPVNGTAIYSLDGAGNVLSVTEKPIGTMIVGGFVPAIGPAGTSVTIGGNFAAATTSNTTVKFNSVTANVTAVSATQLTVTVPSGATTGPVSVTVGSSSYTTVLNFTVPGAAQAPPTITAVSSGSSTSLPFLLVSQAVSTIPTGSSTPTTEYAYVVNITGTNFDTANTQVFLNNNAGQVTSITTTAMIVQFPLSVTTGHITVETPTGLAKTSGHIFVAPISEGYNYGGATGLYPSGTPFPNSAVMNMQSMAIGQSVSVPALKDGQIALIAVDVAAGQSLGGQISSTVCASPNCEANLDIYEPGGLMVSGGNSNGFLALPGFYTPAATAGTALLVVWMTANPFSAQDTSTVHTFLPPPPLQASLPTNGTLTTVTSSTPGQVINLTFSGTAGSRASLGIPQSSNPVPLAINVIAPDGITSVYQGGVDTFPPESQFFSGGFSLPQTGQYTVALTYEGNTPSAVSAQIAAWVFNDIIGTTAYNSKTMPVTFTFTSPGQDAYYTFAGTQGDTMTWITDLTDTAGSQSAICYYAGILPPNSDGTASAENSSLSNSFLPHTVAGCGSSPDQMQILPLTGTYTVVVNQYPPAFYQQSPTSPLFTSWTSDFGIYKISQAANCTSTADPPVPPCLLQTGTATSPGITKLPVSGVGQAIYGIFSPTKNATATVSVTASSTLNCFAVMAGQFRNIPDWQSSTGQNCNGTAIVPSFQVTAGTSYVVWIQPLFPGSPAGMSGFGTGTATLSVVLQ